MDTKARRATIVERLRVDGEASIVELATFFGTSQMTIRRDLDLLEGEGFARRARGGAIATPRRSFEPPILQRASHRAGAKRRIAAAAVQLLRENETVVLDVGTTTYELAKCVGHEIDLTVITSSLLIATELGTRANVKTIVTGGVVRHGELSLVGPRAQAAFNDLNCDTVFLGVAGVSDAKGLTEYNLDDANVKRAALACGGRTIVLADASKIGQVAFVTVAPITAIDLLVTDASPDDATIRIIKDRGIEVLHVASTDEEND